MGEHHYYKPGDWNVLCDICGFEYKGSELRKRWDGFMVCKKDWEPRPPQEYIRAIKETYSTPYSRPDPTEGVARVYSGAIPGYAIPGEAIPGYNALPPPEEQKTEFFPL